MSEPRWHIEHASLFDYLATLAADSVDACVTDPPYELSFMGRRWDASGVAFNPETWRAVFRVLKPGAHLVAFGGTRTVHRIACAIEDAGFDIRDQINWVYGSGFPKSLNVSKAIDAAAGVEQEVVGSRRLTGSAALSTAEKGGTFASNTESSGRTKQVNVTAPTSDSAKLWAGWGTALKPSHEPIIVARKPLRGTVASNVLAVGTGAINVGATRVKYVSNEDQAAAAAAAAAHRLCQDPNRVGEWGLNQGESALAPYLETQGAGRWPPNTLLSHSLDCRRIGMSRVPSNPTWDTPNRECVPAFTGAAVSPVRHADEIPVFECAPGCPVALLDQQSGPLASGFMAAGTKRANGLGFSGAMPSETAEDTIADAGTASRFFPQFEWTEADDLEPFRYCAKPARAERDMGLDGFRAVSGGEATQRKDGSAGVGPRAGAGRTGGARNIHPTVKPIELMRWLVKLITPTGGLVLDPFTGSGTTAIAAMFEGDRFIGCELNDTEAEPFVRIARARIQHVVGGGPIAGSEEQLGLFDARETA